MATAAVRVLGGAAEQNVEDRRRRVEELQGRGATRRFSPQPNLNISNGKFSKVTKSGLGLRLKRACFCSFPGCGECGGRDV